MSIKISSISEYLYCPLKLYLKYYLEDEESAEKENIEPKKNKIPEQSTNSKPYLNKQFLRDFQDLIRRNLWTVKNNMNDSQIEKILYQDVNMLIEKYSEYYESDKDNGNVYNFSEELEKELKLEIQILTLRIKKIMNNTQKEGPHIAEMMFPPSLQNYLMRDKSLQISGSIDKIEIIEGQYFPIKLKTTHPPLRGVWDSDALELAAYSLLIEQEFSTDVIVGFVDYITVDDRRPVVLDSELREGLFIVLDHVRDIINQGNLPEVSINHNKCLKCNYMEICHQET